MSHPVRVRPAVTNAALPIRVSSTGESVWDSTFRHGLEIGCQSLIASMIQRQRQIVAVPGGHRVADARLGRPSGFGRRASVLPSRGRLTIKRPLG